MKNESQTSLNKHLTIKKTLKNSIINLSKSNKQSLLPLATTDRTRKNVQNFESFESPKQLNSQRHSISKLNDIKKTSINNLNDLKKQSLKNIVRENTKSHIFDTLKEKSVKSKPNSLKLLNLNPTQISKVKNHTKSLKSSIFHDYLTKNGEILRGISQEQKVSQMKNNLKLSNSNVQSLVLSPRLLKDKGSINATNISEYSKLAGLNESTSKVPPKIKINLRKEILEFNENQTIINNNAVTENSSNLKKNKSNRLDLMSETLKSKSFFDKQLKIHSQINSVDLTTKKSYFIEKFKDSLSKNEMTELSSYKEIYYYGMQDKDRITNKTKNQNDVDTDTDTIKTQKNKNEKEKNYYLITKGDHIDYRYEIIESVGKGSFGQAVKCYDHKQKQYVCVKLIRAEEKFTNQAKIEIKILESLKSKDSQDNYSFIKIKESFQFRNHMCIVFELLDLNLYELIRNNNFSGLDTIFYQSVCIQILDTLIFLKSNKIIHCDIKPENILLNKWGEYRVSLVDFGSSCFYNQKIYSYIQSRYYRAPEIVLGLGYSFEIDMWSYGCLLCELYVGLPIFSGESEIDQMNYFMEYLGIPQDYILNKSTKKSNFFDLQGKPLKYKHSRGRVRKPNSKKFENFLETEDKLLLDLIKKCLVYDPNLRITPEEANNHQWIKKSREFLREKKIS